jgi:hypothetical protein
MSSRSTTRSTPDATRNPDRPARDTAITRRASTETKASFKTTELFAYLTAVVRVRRLRRWDRG